MRLNVGRELATLRQLTVDRLRTKYAEVFGEQTNTRHKDWLIRRIIWRMQAQAEGDLTERARNRAKELANDADLRMTPPRAAAPAPTITTGPKAKVLFRPGHRVPPPGTILIRDYKGRRIEVLVLANGFEFEGHAYKSLSAVAKAATGQHLNGFQFFRLGKEAA